MRIAYKISCLSVGMVLLGTGILSVLGYNAARKQYYTGINRQLTSCAAALPSVLGEDYLDAAQTGSLSGDRYEQMVHALSTLADESQVYYLYAFAREDGRVFHLATSASPQERVEKDWSYFRMPYERPPANLLATFRDGQPRFAEYTDEYGSFRSIFVRHLDAQRRPYVIGVDISLSEIRAHLREQVIRSVGAGTAVALLAAGMGLFLAQRISRPLVGLTSEVGAWAGRDFARDDAVRAHLAKIGKLHQDEVGDLSRCFVDMQDRLQLYLVELTRATEARQRIEHQLEIAKSIQEGLLPDQMPTLKNFDIVGWCKPADQTGGDYFDWIEFPDHRVMLTIGDVTGHGIGPALVTASARAYARATFNTTEALEATVARLNDLLHRDLKGERFVTLIACLLDPELRTMKLIAAGHGPIVYYSKKRDTVTVREDTHGVPLGAFENFQYDAPTQLKFDVDDVLVLVSDGFYDWMDPNSEPFGTPRLVQSVLKSCREEPTRIIERLRADISAFNGGRGQHDDTTALVIRCTA